MNILLFGATGGTGQQVIIQGLALHHHITAFVRNPAKLSIKNDNLSIVKGDIMNLQAVEQVMKGQDLVISTLGNRTADAFWKPNTIISEAVKQIIAGMNKQSLKRLLFVASFGVNKEIFLPEKLFIRIVLKNIFADIPMQETLIKKSNLNWTIVHPSRLVNKTRTGKYTIGEHLPVGIFSNISRADVADFLLQNLSSKTSYQKTLTISY